MALGVQRGLLLALGVALFASLCFVPTEWLLRLLRQPPEVIPLAATWVRRAGAFHTSRPAAVSQPGSHEVTLEFGVGAQRVMLRQDVDVARTSRAPSTGSSLLGFGLAVRTCGPTALFILIFIYSFLSTF